MLLTSRLIRRQLFSLITKHTHILTAFQNLFQLHQVKLAHTIYMPRQCKYNPMSNQHRPPLVCFSWAPASHLPLLDWSPRPNHLTVPIHWISFFSARPLCSLHVLWRSRLWNVETIQRHWPTERLRGGKNTQRANVSLDFLYITLRDWIEFALNLARSSLSSLTHSYYFCWICDLSVWVTLKKSMLSSVVVVRRVRPPSYLSYFLIHSYLHSRRMCRRWSSRIRGSQSQGHAYWRLVFSSRPITWHGVNDM
jgi:hypothetical protein